MCGGTCESLDTASRWVESLTTDAWFKRPRDFDAWSGYDTTVAAPPVHGSPTNQYHSRTIPKLIASGSSRSSLSLSPSLEPRLCSARLMTSNSVPPS